jgi:hypothetical protein
MIVILGPVTVAATSGVRGNHAAHPLTRRFPAPGDHAPGPLARRPRPAPAIPLRDAPVPLMFLPIPRGGFA